MTSTCPHCGQALDEPHVVRGDRGKPARTAALPVVPLDADDDARTVQDITAGANDTGESAQSPLRRQMSARLLVGIVAAVAALIAAVAWFSSGDEAASSSPAEAAASQTEALDDELVESEVGLEPTELDDAVIAESDALLSDSVANLFRSDVGDWAVVYPSPMGLQILSDQGTNQPAIETATGFEEAAQFPLISDGRRSWAVDPAQLDQAYLVSTQFFVIDIDQDGRVAFINDRREPRNIGESSYGAWGPGFDVPEDAEILAVRERGLFVLPRTGGTFEYVPNGVASFSADVLVAASIDSEVFERCDTQLVCELYLTTPTNPSGQVLDFRARDQLWVSPGGEWLVARTLGGPSMLVSTNSDTRLDFDGTVRAVDWSKDGSLAAVLTDEELTMVFPETLETRSVTLPIAPSAPVVLLVPTS